MKHSVSMMYPTIKISSVTFPVTKCFCTFFWFDVKPPNSEYSAWSVFVQLPIFKRLSSLSAASFLYPIQNLRGHQSFPLSISFSSEGRTYIFPWIGPLPRYASLLSKPPVQKSKMTAKLNRRRMVWSWRFVAFFKFNPCPCPCCHEDTGVGSIFCTSFVLFGNKNKTKTKNIWECQKFHIHLRSEMLGSSINFFTSDRFFDNS